MDWKILALVAALFMASALLFQIWQQPSGDTFVSSFILRAIDGDTISTAKGERIRLIGIDSPEKGEPCFEQAKAWMAQAVEGGLVKLEFGAEPVDKYGRRLAYVFMDGNFLNIGLVEAGLAKAFPYGTNTKYAEQFAVAEQVAREQRIGCLWNAAEAGH